ncbi:MAG: hypothetical protein ASARMPREDX12_007798 [Alectoria sarmentosa]|nr:MAG: hypothetical protein ASARMPREDX12_007798 [Alectoria sarmentosa]
MMALNIFRDLYTSYGKTVVVSLRYLLMAHGKIGSIGFAATALSTLGDGVGPHQWNVPFTAFTPSLLRRFVVLDVLYSPTILMAKLSLLLLYLQIFRPNVRLRYCIYLSMGFLSLFYCATFIAYAVLSIPKPGQSQLAAILSVDTAKDIPLGITQGAVSVASDFYIFCLPIPVVWKLQLPPRKKVGVLSIFMTGLLACIASAFGLYYRVKLGRNSDVTWKLVFVLLWVVVELTVGVMCSCLTSFPGFFRYHLPFFRSILSFLNSSFKSLHLSNPLHRSSEPGKIPHSKPSSAERLATKDIKVTLGSRVDGRGRFFNPETVFATEPKWLPLSEIARNPAVPADNATDATRREYYEEMAERQQSRGRRSPSPHNQHTQGSYIQSAPHAVGEDGLPTEGRAPKTKRGSVGGSAWWKAHRQSNTPRTGYWDIMSFFRMDSAISPGQSKMHSESDSSAV